MPFLCLYAYGHASFGRAQKILDSKYVNKPAYALKGRHVHVYSDLIVKKCCTLLPHESGLQS